MAYNDTEVASQVCHPVDEGNPVLPKASLILICIMIKQTYRIVYT